MNEMEAHQVNQLIQAVNVLNGVVETLSKRIDLLEEKQKEK